MSYSHPKSHNKVIIDNLWEISCSNNPEDLRSIDPNKIGYVYDKNNICISEITPIIITINQNKKNCKDRINILKAIGGDMDMKINYYGKEISANDILK